MEWGRGRTSCPYKFASLYKVSRLHVHVHVYDTPCVLCAMMHIQYMHDVLHMDYGLKSERRK